MNPIKALKLYRLLNQFEAITKENAPMTKVKLPQLLTLLGTLSATIGLPTILTNFLHDHLSIYLGIVAAATVLHAVLPSLFAAPSDADKQAVGLDKAGVLLLVLLLASVASAQTTPTSNGISGSAGPVALQYDGTWSAATLTKQTFDFKDGKTPGNLYHLYLGGYQLLAPTPNVQVYGGFFAYEPDLTKLFKSTNVPDGTFSVFFAGAGGVAVFPGTTGLSYAGGGGIKYRATSNLSWNLAEVYFARIGSQNVPVISSNLSFIFGGQK